MEEKHKGKNNIKVNLRDKLQWCGYPGHSPRQILHISSNVVVKWATVSLWRMSYLQKINEVANGFRNVTNTVQATSPIFLPVSARCFTTANPQFIPPNVSFFLVATIRRVWRILPSIFSNKTFSPGYMISWFFLVLAGKCWARDNILIILQFCSGPPESSFDLQFCSWLP